jgi:hypothetical protein
MKPLLPILLWLWPCLAMAQANEVSSVAKNDTLKAATKAAFQKPEIQPPGL